MAELDHQYSEEKAHYTAIRLRMQVKERVKQDLSGLSDTVVWSGEGGREGGRGGRGKEGWGGGESERKRESVGMIHR